MVWTELDVLLGRKVAARALPERTLAELVGLVDDDFVRKKLLHTQTECMTTEVRAAVQLQHSQSAVPVGSCRLKHARSQRGTCMCRRIDMASQRQAVSTARPRQRCHHNTGCYKGTVRVARHTRCRGCWHCRQWYCAQARKASCKTARCCSPQGAS